jgi:hypothetical protein
MFHSSRTVRAATKSELSKAWPLRTNTNILTALVLASSINAGMASSDTAHDRSANQIAYARDLCTGVIGFYPGEEHFNGCVSSLADSIQNANRGHAIVQARTQCFAQGFNPGSSDLALCLLRADNANPVAGAWTPPDDLNGIDNKDDRAMFAFTSSLGTISDREQQACARLGFDPAFGDFAICIANLQSVVQNVDVPSN